MGNKNPRSMLRNHKLLIDEQCPLCQLYGQGFQQLGWIDQETLSPYQQFPQSPACNIDLDRARNEIALYDPETNTTIYGINSLIHILTGRSAVLRRFLNWKPIHTGLSYLYNFITYNRKVIAPAPLASTGCACTPDRKPLYRWLYIALATLVSALVLSRFAEFLHTQSWMSTQPGREAAIAIGQLVWQGLLVWLLFRQNTLDYLGNLATISLIGSLLLLPVLPLLEAGVLSPLLGILSFGIAVGFMLREHLRRTKLLQLPFWLTGTWVLYRLLLLFILF